MLESTHILGKICRPEPPYIKSARDLFVSSSRMGLLAKVFFIAETRGK